MTHFRSASGERVVATRDEQGQLWVDVRSATGETRRYGPLPPESRARTLAPGGARRAEGRSEDARDSLHARTAGQVARVDVREGDELAAGALVLVMELMKMEVEVRIPHAARVVAVHVAAGDVVARGALLVRLSPS